MESEYAPKRRRNKQMKRKESIVINDDTDEWKQNAIKKSSTKSRSKSSEEEPRRKMSELSALEAWSTDFNEGFSEDVDSKMQSKSQKSEKKVRSVSFDHTSSSAWEAQRQKLTRKCNVSHSLDDVDDDDDDYGGGDIGYDDCSFDKFSVHKAGPREIGWIKGWKPAKYNIKKDTKALFADRISNPKPKKFNPDEMPDDGHDYSGFGKFEAPRKLGPRQIGRNNSWKPADYGINLKKLWQGDFLKDRISSSSRSRKNVNVTLARSKSEGPKKKKKHRARRLKSEVAYSNSRSISRSQEPPAKVEKKSSLRLRIEELEKKTNTLTEENKILKKRLDIRSKSEETLMQSNRLLEDKVDEITAEMNQMKEQFQRLLEFHKNSEPDSQARGRQTRSPPVSAALDSPPPVSIVLGSPPPVSIALGSPPPASIVLDSPPPGKSIATLE